ncbi:hypothetical protein niasHS_011068 [Heterodera schachtii]|uniref:Uncharacterized protein n=1 Tax=Heterodera schachtii TaxID=97005 RepID=A0ABD2IVI4_HETSC
MGQFFSRHLHFCTIYLNEFSPCGDGICFAFDYVPSPPPPMLLKFVPSLLLLSLVLSQRNNGQKSVRVRYPWIALSDGYAEKGHWQPKAMAKSLANRQTTRRGREREEQKQTKDNRNPMTNERLRRRKLVSTRYQSVFGQSKPLRGSEFVPINIDMYTGKLATSRRETFNWVPRGNIFLFPRQ